ncbi:glycoside hydrolase family 3 N-terminal domain-containing protein [Leptodesmis sp.]|uniref:glycoside hydrolase family 3 N-terminal domain-containing protein n=1 Tax=Leptodesmis sp. TaxID=3100501 RepID=UPI00405358BD
MMLPSLPDLHTLSLAAQVAQMIVVRASGYLFDQQIRYPQWEAPAKTLQTWIQVWGVGGVILLGGSAPEVALRIQQLQEWAPIPLLVAADVEEGIGQRFAGATWFPPPMALAAIAQDRPAVARSYTEQMGAITAQEAQAIGLNWILAPVTDVNNNPSNPVINIRAFGETPAVVTDLITAFIQGTQAHPVLTTAKHFPGHGDTAVDSHLQLPILPHSLERLRQLEFPPFQAAIAAGVDAVMTAHLQIPALDSTYPATLSHQILTNELRQTLGFNGLIVTDALIMGAIADHFGANEAAVLAVEAGADLLLMPADPVGAIHAICQAVETGRLTPERIQASVERIWQAKQKACAAHADSQLPHAWEQLPPTVQPQELITHLAQPGAIALVDRILEDSAKAHQPILSRLNQADQPSDRRNLILVDNLLNCKELGHYTPAVKIPEALGYSLHLVDRHTPCHSLESSHLPWQPTLLQLFIRGNPFRSSAGLTQMAQEWLTFLIQSEQLQALILYGSPYTLAQFLPLLPPDVPYVFTYGQTDQAQAIALKALFGSEIST